MEPQPKQAQSSAAGEEAKDESAQKETDGTTERSTSAYALENVPQTSRYDADFEEIGRIGEGGFGKVYKARHKLDGNLYAIKKIKLQKDINSEENKRIRREITYLSGLNNRYIVRYF